MQEPTEEPGGSRTLVLGLVADPDLPTEVAKAVCEQLPEHLAKQIDKGIDWDVRVLSQAMPIGDDGNIEAWTYSAELLEGQGWDYMVCVTELTRRMNSELLIVDVNKSRRAGLVSLPALGPFRMRAHTRDAIVSVMRALLDGVFEPEDVERDQRPLSAGLHSPVSHSTISGDGRTDSYMALTGFLGKVRLLLGMVRINRPWRLMPSLSSAIAAAAAMAAFGVFYSSIWNMADAMSPVRLAVITVISVTSMMVWLMVYNGLLQHTSEILDRRGASLYNTATWLTLGVGVSCMYVLLFIVTLFGALIVIPGSYLESTLGHPVALMDYVSIAWLASSLGAVAGAVGSSFESDAAIRQATYGRREQERHAKSKEREREGGA